TPRAMELADHGGIPRCESTRPRALKPAMETAGSESGYLLDPFPSLGVLYSEAQTIPSSRRMSFAQCGAAPSTNHSFKSCCASALLKSSLRVVMASTQQAVGAIRRRIANAHLGCISSGGTAWSAR